MTNQMVSASLALAAGGSIWLSMQVASLWATTMPVNTTIAKMSEFGIAGILMSVIIYIVYLLLNKTLQGRESDLAWHREELARKAAIFQKCLEDQSQFNERNMAHIVDKFSLSIDKVEQRLSTRTDDLLKILETMRKVDDTLDEVLMVVGGCHEVQQLRLKKPEQKHA